VVTNDCGGKRLEVIQLIAIDAMENKERREIARRDGDEVCRRWRRGFEKNEQDLGSLGKVLF
jgi:hypothetical protein